MRKYIITIEVETSTGSNESGLPQPVLTPDEVLNIRAMLMLALGQCLPAAHTARFVLTTAPEVLFDGAHHLV